ncbi:MAG TPA: hypothetical protein VKE24_06670 [Candidatus Acidoferrales bacterium]|nr:hypothetical protein [Candidatus Acidoferrales bacterium]
MHDAWAIDLRAGPGRTIVNVRALLSEEKPRAANPAVDFFFGHRWWLGRVFGLDREPLLELPRKLSFAVRSTIAANLASVVEHF